MQGIQKCKTNQITSDKQPIYFSREAKHALLLYHSVRPGYQVLVEAKAQRVGDRLTIAASPPSNVFRVGRIDGQERSSCPMQLPMRVAGLPDHRIEIHLQTQQSSSIAR